LTVEDCSPFVVGNQLSFDDRPGSALWLAADEVVEVGKSLTVEQRAAADLWADARDMTGTPSGHWLRIAADSLTMAMSAPEAARIIAIAASVGFDALLACWITKYRELAVRPEWYVNVVQQRAWQPYLRTPPHPEFTSGHSTLSWAMATILTVRAGALTVDTTSRGPGMGEPVVRAVYSNFETAAEAASASRLLGGIHFRQSLAAGRDMGVRTAEASLQRLRG
jgi:hypothetical protein